MKLLIAGTLPRELGSFNYGGVAKVVWNTANKYIDYELDVSIIALGKYIGGDKKVKNISIFSLGINFFVILKVLLVLIKNAERIMDRSFKNIIRLLMCLYLIKKATDLSEYDLVHVHHVHNHVPVALDILDLDIPVFATIHSYHDVIMTSSIKKERKLVKVINEQLMYVDYLSHVSHSVRKQGLDYGVEWNCPDIVIYNGLEIKREQQSKENFYNTICFVGSFIEGKGVFKLVESLDQTSSKIYQIYWLGNGPLRSFIENRDYGQTESKVIGYVDEDEVLDYMARSNILVVPSISESFGLVYLESLVVGTPVIGFHGTINEFREVMNLNERLSDWLIPFNYTDENAFDLANKIKNGINIKKRSTYNEEREQIKNLVEKKFSWNCIVGQYVKCYKEIVSENSGCFR